MSKLAREMAVDKDLSKQAVNFKTGQGHEYRWILQTSWLRKPRLQLPQDMFAIQEAI